MINVLISSVNYSFVGFFLKEEVNQDQGVANNILGYVGGIFFLF